MAKHQTAAALAKAVEARLKAKARSVEHAVDDIARETYTDGLDQLSGRTRQAQLNREGNPYGRGFTNPRGKRRARRQPLPINVQSGELRRSYRLIRDDTGGLKRYRLTFRGGPDYARFVLSKDGTSKMVARPFWNYVLTRFKARKLGLRNALRSK